MSRFSLPMASAATLANGFKYIYYSKAENPIVCIQIHVKTGSAKEKTRQSGYSHFIEHLAFKSTELFPDNDITDYVQSIGGSINAYTDFDSTCYYLLLPTERLAEGILILGQLVTKANFIKQDIDLEKDIILEEIRQYENDPEMDLIEYIQSDYFRLNPIRHPILGYPASVKSATPKKLKNYYMQHYTPLNTFMTVCGRFDERELHSALLLHFNDWQYAPMADTISQSVITEPEKNGFAYLHRKSAFESNFIALAMPELSELHPLSEHYLIGMRYLAIGKASLLYKRLVETEHLCSSVRVLSLSGLNNGASVILINPIEAENRARIIRIVAEEYARSVTYAPPTPEFDLIKADVINGWYYGFESMENLASSLSEEELLGDYRRLYDYENRIEKITPDEVLQALRKYWSSDYFKLYTQSNGYGILTDIPKAIDFDPQNILIPGNKVSKPVEYPSSVSYSSRSGIPRDSISFVRDQYTMFTLPSGLRVLHKQSENSPITGFSLTTDISQLMESSAQRGCNYLCTTAKLYGTERYSYDEVMKFSRRFGFNIRVVHHLDTTSYKGKCFNQHLGQALSLIRDIILFPTFPARHIKTIKEGCIDAIKRDDDYPVAKGYNSWLRLLLGKESNLLRSSGTIGNIRSITRTGIMDWHEHLKDLHRYCLTIVGDYDLAELYDLTSMFFGDTPQISSPPAGATPYYRDPNTRYRHDRQNGDQAVIHLGGFGAKASDIEDTTAFHVLAQIIGGDMGSRFYNILREKHGLAYQTGFDYNSIASMGMWCAYAYSNPEDYKKTYDTMIGILRDLHRNSITRQELTHATEYLVNINRFDYESVSWLASTLANLVVLGYSPDHFIERERRLRDVSLERVNSLCSEWLNPDKYFTHILT